ncbi:MAG: hypothetical protein H7Z41_12415, partial [Cytophagales bacterium]|nr:hypothetical protein [Armatimonadota bacterium]
WWNNFGQQGGGPGPHPVGKSLADIKSPAKTVSFFEVVNSADFDITRPANNAAFTGQDEFYDLFGGSAAGNGAQGLGGFNGAGTSDPPKSGRLKYATGWMRGVVGPQRNVYYDQLGRHSSGSNYVYCDGHAKWNRGDAVSPGNDNTTSANCGDFATNTAANSECGTVSATFSTQ